MIATLYAEAEEADDDVLNPNPPKEGTTEGGTGGRRFNDGDRAREMQETGGRCRYCGEQTTPGQRGPRQWHGDHAHPLSRGGSNDFMNLNGSCRTCNLLKGALTALEFADRLVGWLNPLFRGGG